MSAFASNCIQYNYTGGIMGFDKDSGQLVEAYAMEGAGVGPTVSDAGVFVLGPKFHALATSRVETAILPTPRDCMLPRASMGSHRSVIGWIRRHIAL